MKTELEILKIRNAAFQELCKSKSNLFFDMLDYMRNGHTTAHLVFSELPHLRVGGANA